MATITSNGTGGGLWSAGATWVGGVAPVDNDTVVIASGDTVTFNVDTSAWANGINGMTITGTLKVSTSTSSYMKMKAATVIVGAGTFNIGESGAGAIPFAVKHTLTGGAGWYIDGNDGLTMTVYGAEPSIKYVKLSGDEAIGQTELSVDTDVRGDIWAVGDTITINNIASANQSETRTIAAGGIAETTITVTAGLTAAKLSGSVICLISRNIKILKIGGGSDAYTVKNFASGKLSIAGGQWYSTINNRCLYNCTESVISGGVFTDLGIVFGTCTRLSITGGVVSNPGSVFVGTPTTSAHYISNMIFAGCGTVNGSSYNYFHGCYFFGCQYVSVDNIHSVYSSSIILGCTHGMRYSNTKVINCTFTGNTYDIIGGTTKLYNTSLTSSPEFFGYSLSIFGYSESIDHDQNAGAYKAWTRGGITTSQDSVIPSGYSLGYVTALESATYHGFMKRIFTVAAGEEVSVEVQLRKTASMAYLPRVYLMNSIENPIVDPTQAEDSFTMTDSTDTWESDTFTIDNSAGTTDKDYTLYFVGKNATGSVYSAVDITTQGGTGGSGSVKILPFTGKVGL